MGAILVRSERLEGLDALRGLAAISVAIFHSVVLRELIPADDLPQWFKALYIAVPLFFAISAFSLGAGYFERLKTASDVGNFYLRRILRIAPLFYLMIVVWILTYSYLWRQWKAPPLEDIALNLAFLFNLVPSKAGSIVPAGWSLGVEMIFYALFPLLIVVVRNVWTGLVALIAFSGVATLVGIGFAPDLYAWFSAGSQAPFFVAGILLFHMFRRLKGRSPQARTVTAAGLITTTPALLILLSTLGGNSLAFGGWYPGPHLIGASLLPLLLALALHPFRLIVNRVTVFLGKVSYGIYLIHPFVIVSAGRLLQDAMKGQQQWITVLVVVACVLAMTIILATVTYYGFEQRVSRWRPRKSGRPIETVLATASVAASNARA